MITTVIAIVDFSPVTESAYVNPPTGEGISPGQLPENLSRQLASYVTEVFYGCGEKSVYVNPATGEVIAHIDGAWRGWDARDWEEIIFEVSEFECDFDALFN